MVIQEWLEPADTGKSYPGYDKIELWSKKKVYGGTETLITTISLQDGKHDMTLCMEYFDHWYSRNFTLV
jgi:hypothetical protein